MRPIDADALREDLNDFVDSLKSISSLNVRCAVDGVKIAIKQIEKAPTVEDVVQVIICKDCKQWRKNAGIVDSPDGFCFYHAIEMNGCDFCSYGERRGESE